MLKRYKNLPWPLNLWSAVFEKQIDVNELPNDWEQALDYVLKTLKSEKRTEILKFYFRNGMTLQEIGEIYGTTGEPVRQHAEKAIRAIRHPSRKIYLLVGHQGGREALSLGEAVNESHSEDDGTIDSLGLSVRTWNGLKRAKIETVDHLTSLTEWDLFKLRAMGSKSIEEIKSCLSARGLTLRNEEGCQK